MAFEVEQKFRVEDVAALEKRLAAMQAAPEKATLQVDRYYAHPARDFAQTDEALRIRRVGEKNYVTYKGPKLDKTLKTRREIELPISPGDNGAADFAELLTALGFKPVAKVRKQRRRVEITWQGRAVEGALDEVAGVGTFAELELIADDAGLAAAKQSLLSLAAALELNVVERRSYLEMVLAEERG